MNYHIPPFPVHVLPDKLRHFVINASASLNCPEDFLGVFCLTVMASAIGTARSVRIKNDWTESPVLFTAIVAPPASKKSPAYKKALLPVRDKQAQLNYEHVQDLARHEVELEEWERAKMKGIKPPKPKCKRNFVNDFTMEALAKILQKNTKGLLLGLDELAAWIKSMDQYRKGADREKWLSLWSGGDITVDRASQEESIHINSPSVCVTGGIQPDRLHLLKGAEHDGFLDRILFCFPASIPDEWTDKEIGSVALYAYKSLYNELFELEAEIENSSDLQVPKALDFTASAKESFIKYYNQNIKEIECEADPFLKSAFKKMEAYTTRFALIIQLCFNPQSYFIEQDAIESAIILSEYFKAHTRKVNAHIKGQKIDVKINVAIKAILSNGGSITLRDLYTKKIAGCKNAKSARELFNKLEKHAFGQCEHVINTSGGKPTLIFTLNKYIGTQQSKN